ncbi:MAG TPA: hypothetical protein VFN87_03560 [Solirubrobacteraceae bacterium]|nr:hypothetical protein [Solirubrobacteraceae bacterium]
MPVGGLACSPSTTTTTTAAAAGSSLRRSEANRIGTAAQWTGLGPAITRVAAVAQRRR